MKSYTDLEQSKVLSKILPLESADMCYERMEFTSDIPSTVEYNCMPTFKSNAVIYKAIPCWSLSALLDIVKTYSSRLEIALRADKNYNIFAVSGDFVFRSFDECSEGYNNPIDACYNLVIKLNELKKL